MDGRETGSAVARAAVAAVAEASEGLVAGAARRSCSQRGWG